MSLHTHAHKGTGSAPAPTCWISFGTTTPTGDVLLSRLIGATVYVRHDRFCGAAELVHVCDGWLVVHPNGKNCSPIVLGFAELHHLHFYH